VGTELTLHDPFDGEKKEKIEAQSLATAALATEVLGLLLSFGRASTRTLTIVAPGAGALLSLG